jgi:hypothetical protein
MCEKSGGKFMKIKNIITILTFSAVVFTGCYDDSKNATVRINLGNIPIAKQVDKKSLIDKIFSVFVKDAYAQTVYDSLFIQVVHIGVYSDGELITTESINGNDVAIDGSNNSYVELNVPAGNNRTILVVGAFDSDGTLFARYFGSNTLDLTAGTTTDVSINMDTTIGVNYDSKSGNLIWDYHGGKVKYLVRFNNEEEIYNGYRNWVSIDYQQCNSYSINIAFEDFGLSAEDLTYYYTVCAK